MRARVWQVVGRNGLEVRGPGVWGLVMLVNAWLWGVTVGIVVMMALEL